MEAIRQAVQRVGLSVVVEALRSAVTHFLETLMQNQHRGRDQSIFNIIQLSLQSLPVHIKHSCDPAQTLLLEGDFAACGFGVIARLQMV